MSQLQPGPELSGVADCQCNGGQPRNFVIPCLLLLLHEGSSHGYDLVERLIPFGFNGEPPVVYRNLRRMEAEGLVQSAWETGGKGPARRVYWLTPHGHDHLDAWTIAIKYQRRVLDMFLDRHTEVGMAGELVQSPLFIHTATTKG